MMDLGAYQQIQSSAGGCDITEDGFAAPDEQLFHPATGIGKRPFEVLSIFANQLRSDGEGGIS